MVFGVGYWECDTGRGSGILAGVVGTGSSERVRGISVRVIEIFIIFKRSSDLLSTRSREKTSRLP